MSEHNPPNSDPSWVLSLEQGGDVVRLGSHELPVQIGSGAEDALRVSGLPAGVMQLGMLEGRFFLSPARHPDLRLNGQPFTETRWVSDGDVVECAARRLELRLEEGRLRLRPMGAGSGGETLPPDLDALAREAEEASAAAAARGAGEAISAVEYRARLDAARRGRVRLPSALAVAVWALIGVLAFVGWFAFTAKSVRIVVEPEPQALSLNGTLLQFRLGDRWLLQSGEHHVRAELAGYYPLEEVVEVGTAANQQMRLRMDRLPGLVTLETVPEDIEGEVFIDGQRAGSLPFAQIEVPHGAREFRIEAPRYLAEAFEMEIAGGGEAQSQTVTLTPNWAPVTVQSNPEGAEVRIDGQVVGATPATVEVEAGTRQVELRLAGYNVWRDTLRVLPDQAEEISGVTLQPADGRLRVESVPAGARVAVDGQYHGETPLTVALTPGRAHEVVVSRAGYETARREMSVPAAGQRDLALELVPIFGEVQIDVRPAGAELLVNGRSIGNQRHVWLQAVPQTVTARLSGYASQEVQVTPRPGFVQEVALHLLTEEEAREAAIPRTVTTSLGQELLLMEGGEFVMGSPRGQQGRRSNEIQRPVELNRRFYLGTREVTNAEFRAFQADHDSGRFSGSGLNGDRQPVVNIGWEQAARFLNWLSEQDGLTPAYVEQDNTLVLRDPVPNGYRLPTEAEWEWAARHAGRDQPALFPWGDGLPPPDRSGNFADVSAGRILPVTLVTYNDGFEVSSPVASFEASPAGLHDMGGNVAEWVNDFYMIPNPAQEGQALTNPLGPESGRYRVVRGASWKHASVTELRLTYRDYGDRPREDVGFRIARYLE